MGSFGPPTHNAAAAAKKLPKLQAKVVAEQRTQRQRDLMKRKRLEDLKSSSLESQFAPRRAADTTDVGLQASLPAAHPAKKDVKDKMPRAPSASSKGDEPAPPLDWRVVAACEVVLDHQQDESDKQKQTAKLSRMRHELEAQLEDTKARRARERQEKAAWIKSVRAEAARAAECERAEAETLKQKRLRDRAIFAQQAKEQKESNAAAKAARDAEERALVMAARKSLESEERKRQRAKDEQKVRQDALRKAIKAERELKEERRRA